jgi:hypothetical protein
MPREPHQTAPAHGRARHQSAAPCGPSGDGARPGSTAPGPRIRSTRSIRLPFTATASATRNCASTVSTFPLCRIKSAPSRSPPSRTPPTPAVTEPARGAVTCQTDRRPQSRLSQSTHSLEHGAFYRDSLNFNASLILLTRRSHLAESSRSPPTSAAAEAYHRLAEQR